MDIKNEIEILNKQYRPTGALHRVTLEELNKQFRNAVLRSQATPMTFTNCDLSALPFNGADLSGAWFTSCVLSYTSFRGANLKDANFDNCYAEGIDFDGATMTGANISNCGFWRARFRGTYMDSSKIDSSSFINCNFDGACIIVSNIDFETNFLESDFTKVCAVSSRELSRAKNFSVPMACPDTGGFIGWKQCYRSIPGGQCFIKCIVKLRIPTEAKRSSATGRKCRCDRATVLEIQDLEGNKLPEDTVAKSYHDMHFIYKVGKIVSVDEFCEDRWEECAPGIHFFINRQEAVNY